MNKSILSILIVFIVLSIGACNRTSNIEVQEVASQEQDADSGSEAETEIETPEIRISPEDELTIYARSEYEPFIYLDENEEMTGFVIEVEEAILEEMGQNYRFIPYTDNQQALFDVKVGTVHAILACTRDPIFDVYTLSDTYYSITAPLFVRNETENIGGDNLEQVIESLSGRTVGVQSRGAEVSFFRSYPEIEVREYPTGTVAMEALVNGEVDAKMEVLENGLFLAEQNNWDIKPVGVPIIQIETATGFYAGLDDSTVERYNQAMQIVVENGTFDAIYSRWFE
ncbi:MAG: substrate-binding periplasmic protein [Spirochaetia bacterium]